MRIVVTGASGQVGCELFRCSWPDDVQVDFLSHQELNVTNPDAVRERIVPPLDLVINTAAYTAVDRAEEERDLANQVNAEGARLLATRCELLGVPLIHLSTDYVFDGTHSSPYVEEDKTSPLSIYGVSKLAGEVAVRSTMRAHLIIRTASVFSQFGQNFVKTILRLSAERQNLRVVADQISCPTAAADLATLIVQVAERILKQKTYDGWGTYHFCGKPPITWFRFAQEIFKIAGAHGMATPEIRPISAAEYLAAAPRPMYSALDCSKIVRTFRSAIPSWALRLPEVVSAVLDQRSST